MKNILVALTLAFTIMSCSSTAKKEVETEKRAVGPVNSNQEMMQKTEQILRNSKSLTEDQKSKFMELHKKVIAEVSAINTELRKTKVVFFENMLGKKYSKKKMAVIQNDIRKLYDKRLNVMLKAMEESQEILGVHTNDIYRQTFLDDHFFIHLKD